jgi:hypothetical protein
MKIFIEDPSEWDLKGMLWSGAEKTLEEIVDADMYDNFVSYIEEMYDDGIGLTELNDILRFDGEQVKKDIGMVSWDELSDLCDSKLIEDGIKEVESFIENLDKEDSSYEKDKEDAENTLNALEHLEAEINRSVDDEEITEDLSVIIGTLDGYDSWMLENKKLVSMISDISSWISDHE